MQGLRALAVLAVVLYHLWPGTLPGGYVGVDVFFVISGFLITALLVRELEATGRIELMSFYARRIRRLLPAAFVVLACTLVLLVLVVPRVVWRENLVQIRAASAYLLNWQLAKSQTDYLSADDSPTLVQHYWSLALEEQFYLVWPLLLILAVVVGSRRLRIGLRACLVITLGVTLVVSFAFAVLNTPADPAFGFFATQSHAWEFALGGLVATLPALRLPALVRTGLGSVGVGLVVVACLALTRETSFPGWATLLPTLGTALALMAGGARSTSLWDSPVGACVLWLGDHSYAVYLWHWPLIIALPWVTLQPLDDVSKVAILVSTLVLAALTKRYVEDPVRSGAAWRARRWASVSLATAGATALVLATAVVRLDYDRATDLQAELALASVKEGAQCFGAAAIAEEGCLGRFARPAQSVVDFAATDVPEFQGRCQADPDAPPEPMWCQFGDLTSPRSTIALVGTSYAGRLVPLLLEWTRGQQVRILLAARTNCLGLLTIAVSDQDPQDPCLAWSAHAQARLLTTRNLGLVVFTGHEVSDQLLTGQTAPDASTLAEARRGVLGSLHLFASQSVPTLVVKHPPGTRAVAAPECVARSRTDWDPCAVPRRSVATMDFLSTVARHHPNLTSFLSLDRYFCTGGKCHATIGGLVAFSDDHHISATYARTLARYVGPSLRHAMQLRQAGTPPGS